MLGSFADPKSGLNRNVKLSAMKVARGQSGLIHDDLCGIAQFGVRIGLFHISGALCYFSVNRY